jgi:hypothetical protein
MFKIKPIIDSQTQAVTYEITGDVRQLGLLANVANKASEGDGSVVEKTLSTPGYPDVVFRFLPLSQPTQSVLHG